MPVSSRQKSVSTGCTVGRTNVRNSSTTFPVATSMSTTGSSMISIGANPFLSSHVASRSSTAICVTGCSRSGGRGADSTSSARIVLAVLFSAEPLSSPFDHHRGSSSVGSLRSARTPVLNSATREWMIACVTPSSAMRSTTVAARGPCRILENSAHTRSSETFLRSKGASFSASASSASGVRSPSLPSMNLYARIARSPSSLSRASASPTARSTPFAMSSCPPYGSKSSRRPTCTAMALMVKSRRRRSSLRDFPKVTASGRRPSE
mmetsp:Transcript_44369/g.105745  ORF Transcript_44369/g.105745 Transcript_44369/m.105745 type:complete len:265 (-) Transcript_44369:884-1678(-)